MFDLHLGWHAHKLIVLCIGYHPHPHLTHELPLCHVFGSLSQLNVIVESFPWHVGTPVLNLCRKCMSIEYPCIYLETENAMVLRAVKSTFHQGFILLKPLAEPVELPSLKKIKVPKVMYREAPCNHKCSSS